MYRAILPWALSVLVILTGQGVAASRGVDRAVGQMVLCTGTGPVVVYMDAEGQPTGAPHYCPDYAISLLGAILEAHPTLLSPSGFATVGLPLRDEGLIAAPVPQTPARAPPASV